MNVNKNSKLFLVTIRNGEVVKKKWVTVKDSYLDRESWNCDTIVDFDDGDMFIYGKGAETDDPHTYVNTPLYRCIEFLSDDENKCLETIDRYLSKKINALRNDIRELEKVRLNLKK